MAKFNVFIILLLIFSIPLTVNADLSDTEIDFSQNIKILTSSDPDYTVQPDTPTLIYGCREANIITLESGSKAKLINFPGNNTVVIKGDSKNFTVCRSGAYVKFEGVDGTFISMPATSSVQTIEFDNISSELSIKENKIKLKDQTIDPEKREIGEPSTGNPDGNYPIPAEAEPEDVSYPDHIIGDGTKESCTAEAFIDAVEQGGVIVFDCGPDPVTITLDRPTKIFNDANSNVVIDGNGSVTLSGGGNTRILYMNTCDENQHWTTSHCQNQDHPDLTVQNITFINGNSTAEEEYDGGGAIWVRGGRFKAVNCRFFNNVCKGSGADVGGGAIRVFSQYDNLPVYIVNSTFGGAEGYGNAGSNGGAISSIGVSWTIINSLFSYNQAIGNGGNPAQSGTPGGGSGGAIYNDGNTMTLTILGTLIEQNKVNAYGSAIFFVTNDHSGNIQIEQSIIRNNQGGSWYPVYPGISMHSDTAIEVVTSTIE